MTEQQFTQSIEALVNDYDNAISTRKELFDGICDVVIELVKPKNEEIDVLRARNEVSLNQIESWKSSSTRWREKVDELTEKHEVLLNVSKSHVSDLNNMIDVLLEYAMYETAKEVRNAIAKLNVAISESEGYGYDRIIT